MDMSNKPESYWRPQVLRHISFDGADAFAIHEVHFFDFGIEWGSTEDAVSSRHSSVEELKTALEEFIASGDESIRCGDLNYEYHREDVELWLKHISDPILEYPNE